MNIEIKLVQADYWSENWKGSPLLHCVELSSHTWIANVDGELVCVWGLITPSLLSDKGYLWLHTFPNIPKLIFIRWSRVIISEMLKKHRLIVGHCSTNNPKARRWLRWLGAEFGLQYGELITWQIQSH